MAISRGSASLYKSQSSLSKPRTVRHPERTGLGDHGSRHAYSVGDAGKSKLRVRRALRQRAGSGDASVHGEQLLGGRAATVIEGIGQLRTEASGVEATDGVGDVEVQAVHATYETVGDGHREPTVTGEVRVLKGRDGVTGRLAIEADFPVVIYRPLAGDRSAVGAGEVEAQAVVIHAGLAVGGETGTNPLRIRTVGNPRRAGNGSWR